MVKKRIIPVIFLIFTVLLICALLLSSTKVSDAVRDSLSLCATSVIPSLFPFLVITKLFVGLRLSDVLPSFCKKMMRPIFSVSENSFSAFILGLISGYPIGASVCATLYKDKMITKREAERTLAFCDNAGPAFILSTVGIGLFSSLKIGFTLLLIHISSAFLTGLLFRIFSPIKACSQQKRSLCEKTSFSFAFTDAIYGATISSLTITAYIVFFSVVISLLNKLSPMFSLPPAVRSLFCGILEITSGSFSAIKVSDIKTAFIIISALIGWGGFCVHFQALSFIGGTDLKVSEYFVGKALQGLIIGVLAFFISRTSLFNDIAVFSNGAEHVHKRLIFPVLFIFLSLLYLFFKKGWKKSSI